GSVKPVVAEIVSKKCQPPGPPLVADREERKAVHPGKDGEHQALRNQADQHVSDPHRQAGRCVFAFIEVAVHDCADDGFGSNQKNERWNRKVNQVGHRCATRSEGAFYSSPSANGSRSKFSPALNSASDHDSKFTNGMAGSADV